MKEVEIIRKALVVAVVAGLPGCARALLKRPFDAVIELEAPISDMAIDLNLRDCSPFTSVSLPALTFATGLEIAVNESGGVFVTFSPSSALSSSVNSLSTSMKVYLELTASEQRVVTWEAVPRELRAQGRVLAMHMLDRSEASVRHGDIVVREILLKTCANDLGRVSDYWIPAGPHIDWTADPAWP